MEKNEFEDNIKKLKELEENISSFDDINEDSKFINELETLLGFFKGDNNSNTLKVKIKKLKDNVIIPKYSKNGDAGLDLISVDIKSETDKDVTYGTGIAVEIPNGYVGLVFPRSSIRNYGLVLSNSVGVIDSGYRGEIQVSFKKTSQINHYNIGDKIAQIIILPYPNIEFIETNELSDTERGDKGFGSTGN